MSVIKQIQVSGFRSLRRARLDDLDEYMPVIGMNGTGKSNLLRALNLFFNGTPEVEEQTLDLAADFTDHLKQKKREVSVEVQFDVEKGFLPKGTHDFVAAYAVSDGLRIKRHWSLLTGTKELIEDIYAEGKLLQSGGTDRAAALALIRAVTFRYVSNHVRPADVIRDNVRMLRPTLVKRVKQTTAFNEGNIDIAMKEMSHVASNMISDVSARVSAGTQEIAEIAADLPDDFADLAFELALRTVSNAGVAQLIERQGSGSQSFMLMHLLDLLDRAARERGFGWVQQHIWAIEEPESFLHAALRSRFAHDLREHAAHERRQVIVTTHQDEFIRTGEHAWTARLDGGSTTFTRDGVQAAVLESARLRVTSFQHPLLNWAEVPLVLVEGRTDLKYLQRAIREAGMRPRWRLISMEDLEPTLGGGSEIITYLRQNPSLLAARPESAPVIVLKDWEVAAKDVNAAKKSVGPHATSTAVRIPEDLVNPQLGKKFRGIERLLPTDVVSAVVAEDDVIPASIANKYPLGIERDRLERYKKDLVDEVERCGSVGPYLVQAVKWIDGEVDKALGQAPPDLFL